MKDKKKLAIQFFGHLRTYDKTYKSFFENIIDVNKKEWEIDIFIHTFDTINGSKPATHWWHDGYEESWDKTPIDSKIQEEIKSIYKPKKLSITHLNPGEYGQYISMENVNNLRKEYEQEKNIKYDLYLYTRPDILFESPLKINMYLDEYKTNDNLKVIGLPDKYVFCSSNVFQRMPVIDSRHVCEGDLIFFSNCDIKSQIFHRIIPDNDILIIQIDYRLWRDFFIIRYYGKWDVKYTEYYKMREFQAQFSDLVNKYNELENILNNSGISYDKKKDYSAKNIVKNSLDYKLGIAIMDNSSSFLDYVKLPFILSYITKKYNETKDKDLESIKLHTYPDYTQALEIMNSMPYKLGEAYIKYNRIWYKGYIRFILKARKIKKKFNT